MDPGEESFTLSSFDFNSSFALYSSDDEELDQRNYRDYDDDVDTYIELELGSAAAQVQSQDDELRISFSALVPFPGFFPSSASTAIINVSSKATPFSDPNAAVDSTTTPAEDQVVMESTPSTIKRPRLIGNRTSTIRLAWTRFPPSVHHHDSPHINGSWDLVPTRKASAAVKGGGGMRKLLVKLRSVIISGFGSMRVSLAQLAQPSGSSWPALTSRWLALCKPPQRVAAASSQVRRSSLKVTSDMKFETTTRKLFGSAVSQIKNKGISSKNKRIMHKSCPTSVKASPVHQLGIGDASLLNAAIAHCNKSFAQTHDFSFS